MKKFGLTSFGLWIDKVLGVNAGSVVAGNAVTGNAVAGIVFIGTIQSDERSLMDLARAYLALPRHGEARTWYHGQSGWFGDLLQNHRERGLGDLPKKRGSVYGMCLSRLARCRPTVQRLRDADGHVKKRLAASRK